VLREEQVVRNGQLTILEALPFLSAGSTDMFSSVEKEGITVNIERPESNVRRISGSVVVDTPVSGCWDILTDYNNLAVHVPNLVESKLVEWPSPNKPQNKWRLYQEGAQKIIGFNFRAAVTLDMEEKVMPSSESFESHSIDFTMAESMYFAQFDGTWRAQLNGRRLVGRNPDGSPKYEYTSKLFYCVTIRPKGVVPVMALEWRIKEDVPINLKAVKVAAEKLWKQRSEASELAAKARALRQSEPLGPLDDLELESETDPGVSQEETLSVYSDATQREETLEAYNNVR